jgi:hypothetical protein
MNMNISFNLIVETSDTAISGVARKKLQRGQCPLSILHKLCESCPYKLRN